MRSLRRCTRLLALVAVLAGCRAAPPANVVVVLVDTLRADHLGCYGYSRPTSPNIDRLAAGGYVFEEAVAQSSWTSPSVASLFTSVYPSRHGVVDFGAKLTGVHATLAQEMQRRGRGTAAISANMAFVIPDRGFALGFDRFEVAKRRARPGEESDAIFRQVPENAEVVTTMALAALDELAGSPFFLYVHYIDPHAPYDAPPPYRDRFLEPEAAGTGRRLFGASGVVVAGAGDVPALTALYDAEIAYTDAQIGRLLERLEADRLLDDTIVVVTSDHGEELHDHGGFSHGTTLYREQVQVPLVVRLPGGRRGERRVTDPVELVDVGPTLLELLGEADRRTTDGASFAQVFGRRTPVDRVRSWAAAWSGTPAREAFGYSELGRKMRTEAKPPRHSRSLRTADWHYLDGENGDAELYDNAADPNQTQNQLAARPEVARELAGRLGDVGNAGGDPGGRDAAAPDALDDEDRERLRALGYVE